MPLLAAPVKEELRCPLGKSSNELVFVQVLYTISTEEVMNRGLTQGYKVCLIFRRLPVWPPC